ncbi:MAG: NHL repeat-containing protein [Verrucomicrobiia bacterium]
MNNAPKSLEKATRRQFLRRSVGGASLFGLGSASGLLSFPAQAEKPAVGAGGGGRSLGKEFTYDLSKFYKTDPALIQYDESAKIATGFKELRAVATGPEDRVYVAGDLAVRVFSKAGERAGGFELSERPRCLAVAATGNIFVGMKNHVEVFSLSGARQSQWESAGSDALLTAVAVAEKDVFVADAGNRVVLRYDLAGRLLGRIGKKDPEKHILGFIVPSPHLDLSVGADGLLWVVNPGRHRLEAYTFDGEIRNYWGEESLGLKGFCGCCNPIHFARLSDGRFVTSEKGLPRVKVYSAQGDFEGVVAGPELFPKQMENPNATVASGVCMDLAVDSAGRILLADAFSREIRVFTRKK